MASGMQGNEEKRGTYIQRDREVGTQ
jgi:hypothetical protein